MAKCNIVANNNKSYKVTAKAVNEASCKNHALKEKANGFEKKVNKLEKGIIDVIKNAIKNEISNIIKNNPKTISKLSDFDLVLVGKKEAFISDLKSVGGYDNSNVLVNKHDQIFTHLYKGNESNFKITLVFPNNVFHNYKLNLSQYTLELIALINSEIPIRFGAPPSLLGRHTLGVLNNSIKLESGLTPKADLNHNNYGTGKPWNGLRVYASIPIDNGPILVSQLNNGDFLVNSVERTKQGDQQMILKPYNMKGGSARSDMLPFTLPPPLGTRYDNWQHKNEVYIQQYLLYPNYWKGVRKSMTVNDEVYQFWGLWKINAYPQQTLPFAFYVRYGA